MKRKRLLFLLLIALFVPLAANAQTSLWSEDFESGSMPSGWTTSGNGSWSVATAVNSTHPSSAGHGTYCAQIKHGTTGNATKLITPEIDLSSVTSAELSFMHAQQSWSGDIDGLKVYYRTSTSGAWTQLVEYTDAYASWTTEEGIILPNLSSTYQIAFEYIDNYGYGLGIDNINIVRGASCPAPQTVAASNPTAHGATISWSGTSDSYIVMVAEPVVNASYDFETGSMPSAFTNSSTYAWTVVANTHSGAYCAKSAGGFTSTNSDLSLTVNLATAGSVDFSALVSSESGWDFGRFLIDGNQKFEVSGTSNSWTDYSYPLTAGSHTLTWRYYKDSSGNNGDDCFYVDDIVIKEEPSTWYQYPAASSPYTLNDATNIHSATDYMVQVVGVCSGEQSNPSATVSFTTTETCPKPTNLQVTTDGATATVTWDGGATCNVNFNGTIYPSQTSGCSFPVQLSTTYSVAAEAVCSGETSGYCTPVSFTTPDCIGGHTIEYTLNDSYGDGWTGSTISAILITDACGNTQTLTLPSGSYTGSGSLILCGSYYQITWQAGQYPSECTFTLSDNGTVLYSNQAGSSLTDGQVLYTIGTLVPAPTSLTAGTPTTNSVVLNWTAGGSETAWQICVNGDETNLITANTNVDYPLTGLSLDTEYVVKVRAYIDANNQSCWSNTVRFTTEASDCHKPTNVTASDITINSAHISWSGEADSYNVRYATATVTGTELEEIFFDDFENGFGNWTTYALGDYTDDTWALTNSTLVDSYHSGSYGALTRSYYGGVDVSVDNWLVSPQMTLGDVLKFWVVGDNNNYQEYFAVYVSLGTNDPGDFEMVEAPELAPGDGTWAERTVDLSAYAGQNGYIAIRHTDFAQDFLILDDFGVYRTVNAYSYGEFTTLPPTTETSADITGLNPSTLYAAQVQADCGGTDGTSAWSSVYFTTPDACMALTNLVASNITTTTAALAWSDNLDEYNLQYRKVHYFESFEGETLPAGWTTIDANNDGNTWGLFHVTTHSGNNAAANLSYIYGETGTEPDDYLVSPLLDLQGTLSVWLSGITASTYAEHFEILLSTKGNTVEDFTDENVIVLVSETTTTNAYVEYTADLSSYEGQTGFIAIHHFNCTDQRYLYVDDFAIYGSEWETAEANANGTATLTGLTPETTYGWQVQGLNCDGEGTPTEWSALANFTTADYPCAKPTNLTIDAVGGRNVVLSWTENGEATEWQICVNDDLEHLTTANSNDNFELTGLTPVTFYKVRVRANCGGDDGVSLWSNTVTFTTLESCPAPSNLVAGTPEARSVVLNWAAGGTESEWQICINGDETNLVSANTNVDFELTGLTPETEYTVKVRAYCGGEDYSEWTSTVTFTTAEETTITQTIALTAGFNYISASVDITLDDLKAALVEAMPGTTIRIYSKNNGNTTYNGSRWRGSLASLDVTQMYIIEAPTDSEITLEGMPINPAEHPVTITSDFNWIAFPFNTNMAVADAFAGFAVNGDKVYSKNNGTTTYNGSRWRGTLSTLVPGQGYIYVSASDEDRTFTFPTSAKKSMSSKKFGITSFMNMLNKSNNEAKTRNGYIPSTKK